MTPSEEEAERAAFKAKLRSLSFGFAFGRDQFHGPTIRERQEHMITKSRENGHEITPIGHRTYTGR